MRSIIARLARLVPRRFKEVVVGSRAHPSWAAETIHRTLNQVPGEKFPCLPCAGILEGYRMRVDWSRFRAFVYGTWEPEIVRALTGIVREGFVAIDVGAHLGYYALILSRLVGPTGRVIAFEPMPSNFRILSENIKLNRCTNVRLVNKAVSDRSERFEANFPTESDLPSSFSLLNREGAESIAVDTISLDEFLIGWNGPVDFVEIDVEGAEEMVLKGAQKTIRTHRPTLLVEIHHFVTPLEASPVPRQLIELGYKLEWLSKSETTSHVLATCSVRASSGMAVAPVSANG